MKGVDNMEFQSKKILEQFKVKEERSYTKTNILHMFVRSLT